MKKNTKKIGLIALTALFSTCMFSACALNFNSEESNPKKPASSETFNGGVYIRPDYAIDGKLDESIWKNAPSVSFGKENTQDNEVTFQWYYGENGVTAAFKTIIFVITTRRTSFQNYSSCPIVYICLWT